MKSFVFIGCNSIDNGNAVYNALITINPIRNRKLVETVIHTIYFNLRKFLDNSHLSLEFQKYDIF